MANDPARDRRRHRRVEMRAAIRLSTIDPEIDPHSGRPFFRVCEESCTNLSRGGARVRTREPLVPGRRLLLEMQLPDGCSFEAIARVAWWRPESAASRERAEIGIGVKFLGGTPDHLARLAGFLAERPEAA